jgi:hypothetical protein
MFFKLLEKHLAQTSGVYKQTEFGVIILNEDSRVQKLLIDEARASALRDLEGHPATR